MRESDERALIFDMDGVLIDSEPLWRRAEIELFATVGLQLEEADCLETQGLRIDEAVGFWFERSPWPGSPPSEIATAIVDRMVQLIENEGEPMPAVLDTLTWAASSSWRVALASSSSHRLIKTVLTRFELIEHFEVTRSAEDEALGKPDPGVYRSTARDLQLDPSACVAIEDSANGVASALAAGMRCIAIPPPETRDDPRFKEATIRLESLRELQEALKTV